jgi:hypothetical protein
MEIFITIIIWLVCAIIGASMAGNRGRSTVGGFMLGLLLGLIGIAIIAIAGEKRT